MWYVTRGTAAVALLLLTGSVAFGVADVARWRSGRWPRFVVDDLHRVLSLGAVALVVVHVITSVLDSFAPVGWLDALVPFVGSYRPLWLGLGTVSFDLLLVLIVSSLLRHRMGLRVWRAIHWSAWACWPPALVHTLGTGSDVRRGWMLVLGLACTAVIVLAVLVRVWRAAGVFAGVARAGAGAAVTVGVVALALWIPTGPLGRGWSRRAGTPVRLLAPQLARETIRPEPVAGAIAPFDARASGRVHQGTDGRGRGLADVALQMGTAERDRLDIRLEGIPLPDGGISLRRSQVTLGPPSDPARYVGRVTSLAGSQLQARVAPLRGQPLLLHVGLTLDTATGRAQAVVSARVAS